MNYAFLKNRIALFCILFLSINIYSQSESSFTPVEFNNESALIKYNSSEKHINKLIDNYNGPYKKEFNENWNNSKKQLNEYYYKRIFFSDIYQEYLNSIVDVIVKGNPTLIKNKINPYFIIDEQANATSTGESSIFINLGLLEILDNESELAFIISHEIAHEILNHRAIELVQYYDNMYSDEVQTKFKKAKKIDKFNELKNLSLSLGFMSSKHSRFKESEADSMALELIKNTKYSNYKSINGVNQLTKADKENFDINDILQLTFDSENFPFLSKWIYKKESMGDAMKYSLSKEIKDSLSTHPETELRYNFLKSIAKGDSSNSSFEVSNSVFQNAKKDFKTQIVYSLFKKNRISETMYYILKYQNLGETGDFYTKTMAACLEKLALGIENHTLSDFIDTRNPFYPSEYNKLLIFIDNLNSSELQSILKNYKLKNNI